MTRRRSEAPIASEKGSGNVWADLGYADGDAMLIKAQLVTKIAEIIAKKGLTQQEAARRLGLTQPRVSALLKGQFRGVSERRLMDCLTRLGRDIQIVVKRVPRSRETGKLTVLFG
jgi:predicted XRE-type DNA-binding protein